MEKVGWKAMEKKLYYLYRSEIFLSFVPSYLRVFPSCPHENNKLT
jgi:hypothetical protein